MLLLPAVFLLSGVFRGASADEPAPTYEHRLLACDMCPPGTHLLAHCSATAPTRCAPCRRDHFTALWNYLPRCLYCSTFCTENQEVETECSPVSDRVCRCREGFYWNGDFCARHTECAPGHGVQTKGTSRTNSVCEKCPAGFFSQTSSALETCVKHQECAGGQLTLLSGTIYQDTLCSSCEALSRDHSDTRKLLTAFFSAHKMRVAKMKKFVTRLIHCSIRRQRGHLMDHIGEWLAQAPEEELRKVPKMLKASHLASMAEKLERSLLWLEEQRAACASNHTVTDSQGPWQVDVQASNSE